MLNKDNQLIGKNHYIIKTGVVVKFDQFNDEGEVIGTMEVTTAEDICVWIENTRVPLSSFKNVQDGEKND